MQARATLRSVPSRIYPGLPPGKSRNSLEIFFLAGEPSGDRYGAGLATVLNELSPGTKLSGVGGTQMRAAGVDLLYDSSTWGTIGITESLRHAPSLMAKFRTIVHHLCTSPPQVLVLIDFGFFNLRIARVAHRRGLATLYYLPPHSWSREPGYRGELPWLVDRIATPFPWSQALLSGGTAQVQWVGHPLLDTGRPTLSREEAAAHWGLDRTQPLVALIPGSRLQEINHLLPVFLEAARLLRQKLASVQFLIAVAPAMRKAVRAQLAHAPVPLVVLEGMDYNALQLARVALAASGTATLELTCLHIPMVIAYRASFGTWLQYRWARRQGKLQVIGLPNIIAQRQVVPELLQAEATPQRIAEEATRLLTDHVYHQTVVAGLAQVATELGEPGATRRTAEMVLALAAERFPARGNS